MRARDAVDAVFGTPDLKTLAIVRTIALESIQFALPKEAGTRIDGEIVVHSVTKLPEPSGRSSTTDPIKPREKRYFTTTFDVTFVGRDGKTIHFGGYCNTFKKRGNGIEQWDDAMMTFPEGEGLLVESLTLKIGNGSLCAATAMPVPEIIHVEDLTPSSLIGK